MALVGNPQNSLRLIHIAGTKGKGSTAIILSRLLELAGYKVGLFTSPHLISLQERIQINGVHISKKSFTEMMNRLHHFSLPRLTSNIQLLTSSVNPTFFELITAVALLYLNKQKFYFSVMEVGLGGRLDATNIITPLASVITTIDFDHMDKLGYSLAKIAGEKAGIIKKSVPVFCAENENTVRQVIKKTARAKQSLLYLVGKDIKITQCRNSDPADSGTSKFSSVFNLKTPFHHYRHLKLSLPGKHQVQNTALALGVIDYLRHKKIIRIQPAAIKKTLRQIILPGRIEVVKKSPDLILDGAHNPVSIRALKETISRSFKYKKLILILAISRDKETDKILNLILPISDVIILTKTGHPRLWEPLELVPQIPGHFFSRPVFLEPNPKKALLIAETLSSKKDLILVTGSFYLAGKIKEILTTDYTD